MESNKLPTSAYERLNDRQRLFVDAYVQTKNKTKAALAAGYAASGAGQEGHRLLKNAEIWAAKEERMSLFAMGAEEAMQRMSDVASTRLNEYFTVEKVQRPGPKVQQPIAEAIAQIEQTVLFEDEVAKRSGLGKKEMKLHKSQQVARRRAIIRMQVQLEADPDAFRLVDGPPIEVEVADLDLVALARAEGEGLLTEFKHTKEGIQVKIADPVPALRDILRIHGKFEKDNEQQAPKIMPEIRVYTGAPPLASSEKEVAE